MTIEPERPFNPRIVPTCVALALIAVGAALRLAGAWLVNRGVAAGDYGIAFYNRKAQAEAIVSRSPGAYVRPDGYTCEIAPAEVTWLVEWTIPGRSTTMPMSYICSAWIDATAIGSTSG